MKNPHQTFKRLLRKSKRGSLGYPIATVAFYGPDNKNATKVVVGIFESEGGGVDPMKKWFSEEIDVRKDADIGEEITEFIRSYEVRTVKMVDGIMGCPHEEGPDYPEGESCPQCPYWKSRDRFSGTMLH